MKPTTETKRGTMDLETCLTTDVQELLDLVRDENETAALAALGAILVRRESEVLTKALQEARAETVATLKALNQAEAETRAEYEAADEAARKARGVVAALPDLRDALEAGRLAEAQAEQAAAEAELAKAERQRQQVQAQLNQMARPRVRKATDRLADINARLAALADPPQPDRAALAVLAEALIGGPRDSD